MSLERQVAIIGAAGMLGHALQTAFPRASLFDCKTLDSGTIRFVDITTRENVFDTLGSFLRKGDYLINAAAYTDVDGAETREGRIQSLSINVLGPTHLTYLARDHDILLVHYSTAYVFEGILSPYSEGDKPRPLNTYGQHKLWGESPVISDGKGVVLRTDMLYGPHGRNNIVDSMVRTIKEDKIVPGVTDYFGNPTYTMTLANITKQIIDLWERDAFPSAGVYHATSRNGSSGAELAEEIVRLLGEGAVASMDMDKYRARYREGKPDAKRPRDCRLSTAKLQALGVTAPDWKSDLETYVHDYLMNKKQQPPAKTQNTSQGPSEHL